VTDPPELQVVSRFAAVWQRYDPHIKADLWSTALRTASGVYLIDPIPIEEGSLAEFMGSFPVAAIIATNQNHLRDAPSFCSRFGAPFFSRFHASARRVEATSSSEAPAGLTIIDVAGAPPGEIAIVSSNGDLVIGDALINFEPHGFAFLPDKYCNDPAQMRQSLRQLLDFDFDRLFLAHGTPITTNAHQRLESLLGSADV
jgi:glyoxylase-like metal-dependent hydrolase (beta-lactamase superfamily II)